MKITKLGHACLLVETKGKRILIDPGSFTAEAQGEEKNIDLILITHAHGDHFDLPSVQKLIGNNPNAKIVTNQEIGQELAKAGIAYEILDNETPKDFGGVMIEAFQKAKHEEIFQDLGQVENTGFLIDERLYHPGDSLYVPDRAVEILALPVGGPWNNVRMFMDFALAVKPKISFPIHDGMFSKATGSAYFAPQALLPERGIEFKILEKGVPQEF